MRQATAVALAGVALLVQDGQAFVPAPLTSRARAAPSSHALKMAVEMPPKKKPEFAEDRVADEELLSVIELAGRKAAAAGFLPVLGAKAKEEQDIMWKLKVRVRPSKW